MCLKYPYPPYNASLQPWVTANIAQPQHHSGHHFSHRPSSQVNIESTMPQWIGTDHVGLPVRISYCYDVVSSAPSDDALPGPAHGSAPIGPAYAGTFADAALAIQTVAPRRARNGHRQHMLLLDPRRPTEDSTPQHLHFLRHRGLLLSPVEHQHSSAAVVL